MRQSKRSYYRNMATAHLMGALFFALLTYALADDITLMVFTFAPSLFYAALSGFWFSMYVAMREDVGNE
jgi:hypothetical protein